jgi:hypothetical protein
VFFSASMHTSKQVMCTSELLWWYVVFLTLKVKPSMQTPANVFLQKYVELGTTKENFSIKLHILHTNFTYSG